MAFVPGELRLALSAPDKTRLAVMLRSPGVDVNEPLYRPGGVTLAHIAADLDEFNSLNVLRHCGADFGLRAEAGELPHHKAAHAKALTSLKLLRAAHPAGFATPSSNGSLPHHISCHVGDFKTIKWLFHKFPEGFAVCDNNGNLPLMLAALNGSLKVVDWLLRRLSAEALVEPSYLLRLIVDHGAPSYPPSTLIYLIVVQGADPHEVGEDGKTTIEVVHEQKAKAPKTDMVVFASKYIGKLRPWAFGRDFIGINRTNAVRELCSGTSSAEWLFQIAKGLEERWDALRVFQAAAVHIQPQRSKRGRKRKIDGQGKALLGLLQTEAVSNFKPDSSSLLSTVGKEVMRFL